MIDEDVGRLMKCGIRGDRTVGNDLEIELLVVCLLLHTIVLHAPVDLADRGVDGIDRNGSDRRVLVPELLGRHESPSLGDGDGDSELDRRLKRADVQFRIQHHKGRQSF